MGARWGHRRTALGVATAAAATAVLGGVGDASAGTYTVWACANASGTPLGVGDWKPTQVDAFSDAGSSCGQSSQQGIGAMTATARATPGSPAISTGGAWGLTAPEGLRFGALDVWWTTTVSPPPPFGRVQVYAENLNDGLANTAFHRDGPGTVGAASATDPGVAYAEANHQAFADLKGSHFVSLNAWCINQCNTTTADTANFTAYRTRTVVEDPTAPTGSASGLTAGTRVGAPVGISASAVDGGSGVRELSLRVDGAVRDRVGGEGACADVDPSSADAREYNLLKPCPGSRSAALTLLPAHLAGAEAHLVTVVATDAAGNDTTLLSARVPAAGGLANPDLDVNAPRRVNGANGGAAAMRYGFRTRRVTRRRGKRRVRVVLRSARTVSFGARPTTQGRVLTPDGRAIAAARVYRVTRPSSRSPWRIASRVLTTSRRGGVTVRPVANGPGRQLALAYFPYSDSDAVTISPVARLAVRAPVSLALGRHRIRVGGRLRVTARLRGGFTGPRSVVGTLQFRSGRQWRTFRGLRFRPSRRGVDRTVVRFRSSPRGRRVRLRVRVPRQSGLRYTTGVSRVRVVRVGG